MKRYLMIVFGVCVVFLHTFSGVAAGKLKFYVVTHGGSTDPFWGIVKKGAADAGKEFDVDVTYLGAERYSIQKFIDLIETAVAANPDGLVITIPDAKALDLPVREAIKRGIPVVAINIPDSRSFENVIPYLAYVGADDYKIGIEAAKRMLMEFRDAPPKRGVILIHEVGYAGLEARAKGITEEFSKKGIPVERLVGAPKISENYQALDAYLARNPDTDVVFTLGPPGAHATLKLLDDKQLAGRIKVGGIDLSATIIKAIKEEKMVFTVEQQQYLQGYLPVALLILYNKYGLIPHDDILTGPAIVDKYNVNIVEETVKKKYR